jgi:hypothetical protein
MGLVKVTKGGGGQSIGEMSLKSLVFLCPPLLYLQNYLILSGNLSEYFFHEWHKLYVIGSQYTVTDEWLDFFNQGLGIYIIVIIHYRRNYIKNYGPKQ